MHNEYFLQPGQTSAYHLFTFNPLSANKSFSGFVQTLKLFILNLILLTHIVEKLARKNFLNHHLNVVFYWPLQTPLKFI